MSDTFTRLEMEAAMCLWEAFCELAYDSEPKGELRDIAHALRENYGTVTMRHACLLAAPAALALYDRMTEDDKDRFFGWAYDWEVIPSILHHTLLIAGPHLPINREGDALGLRWAMEKHSDAICKAVCYELPADLSRP